MRAIFLDRRFYDTTKKSGKPMNVLTVYRLPSVDEETGIVKRGDVAQYFLTGSNQLSLGANCSTGDIVDITMTLDEARNVGVPSSLEVVVSSPYDKDELLVK